MRRHLALLCLSLGLVQAVAAVEQEAAHLPAPYRITATQTTTKGQLILGSWAERFTAQAGFNPAVPNVHAFSLLVLRDHQTGRTLWKRYVGGEIRLNAIRGHIIELVHTGGIWTSSRYDLRDGRLIDRKMNRR